jgi:hypothetical protein
MPKMVTIHYKCSCMQDEGSFEMPARRFNEDTADFIARLQKWLGEDHSQRSPFCRAAKTEYVKIPTLGEDRPIGSSKEDLN